MFFLLKSSVLISVSLLGVPYTSGQSLTRTNVYAIYIWRLILFVAAVFFTNSSTILSTIKTISLGINSSSDASPKAVSSAQLSFKRSPQCTASRLSVLADQPVTTETKVQTLIVSESNTRFFHIIDPKAGATAGVTLTGPITTLFTDSPMTYSQDTDGDCCGRCSIFFAAVEVKYWPASSSVTDCLQSIDPFYSTNTNTNNPGKYDTRPASNTGNIPIAYPSLAPRVPTPTNNASLLRYMVDSDGLT